MISPQIQQGRYEKAASGWFRGCNSVRNPWILDDAMYSWGVNIVNKGGIPQTRPGYLMLLTLPPGNLQGMEVITINKLDINGNVFLGGAQYLVFAVDGLVYSTPFPLVQPNNNDWTSQRLQNLQFNRNATRVYFCEAQSSVTTSTDGNLSLATTYNIMIMQDGVGPAAFWDGELNEHVNENAPDYSVPTGTWMAYSGNRLWIARDTALLASDLLNPLSFQERINGQGRGDFYLPLPITGMVNTIGYTFQTNLIVFTEQQTFSFQSFIADRNTWQSTPNFQTTLYPSLGCVAGLSIFNHEGLLWWYSPGGLVSSNSATTAYLSSRIKYQDVEMAFATSKMYRDMSGICGCSFGSYLLMSIPSDDYFNNATMVMDYSVADELLSSEPPAWQGIWTGTRPVKWITPKVNGSAQALFCSIDYEAVNGSHNHVWQAFQNDRTDSYTFLNSNNVIEQVHNQIYCSWESKLFGDGLDLKFFKYSILNLRELSGSVNFKCSYRGLRGSYKEILNVKISAITDAWQTDNQEIIDLLNNGTVLVPQSRRLLTETVQPKNQELDVSAESILDESIDRCFSLYLQWCGRAGLDSLEIIMEPYPEKPTGECTPDETTLNIVTQDGSSQRINEGTSSQPTIIGPLPEPSIFGNQLYNQPMTPRYRSVYYTSIPSIIIPRETIFNCETCLPCARDTFPKLTFDPTTNDPAQGAGPEAYSGNQEQVYTATCPQGYSGNPVTFYVPKNYFFAPNQSEANKIAYNYAVEQATAQLVCTITPPVVQSDTETDNQNVFFSYQIVGTNNPTFYGATNLPNGLSVDASTGIISGNPTDVGTTVIDISASNGGGTGNGTLTLNVFPIASDPFASCMNSPNWPSSSSGIPYSNSGSTVSGITPQLVEGSTFTSDGTIITGTSIQPGTGNLELALYQLPAVVSGDFTATMEVNPVSQVALTVGFVLFDDSLARAIFLNYLSGSPGQRDYQFIPYCNIGTTNYPYTPTQVVQGDYLTSGVWTEMLVKRVGNYLYFSNSNGLQAIFQFNSSFAANIGIGFTGLVSLQFRNINITQP